jgi:hypothetical protein
MNDFHKRSEAIRPPFVMTERLKVIASSKHSVDKENNTVSFSTHNPKQDELLFTWGIITRPLCRRSNK